MTAAAALSIIQGGAGLVQTITGANKTKNLIQRRKAYQTPEEYFKILNATASRAAEGYDPVTMSYLTNQADRAFGASIGTATRLGADPNQLSAILDQRIQASMKVGAENAALNLQNFNRYLSALDVLGQNDAAEQKSRDDLLKDQIQSAAAEKQAGVQNIINAASSYLGATSAAGAAGLYLERGNFDVESARVSGSATPGRAVQNSGLSTVPAPNVNSSNIYVPNRPLIGG